MSVPKLLVIGGNGFLGSAICKSAVTKGWQVSSMSSSGKPYTTPAGHSPSWVSGVTWHSGSAFDPSSYTSLVGQSTAVVHTLGILLEDTGYKESVRNGDIIGLTKSLFSTIGASGSGSGNPLKSEKERQRGYEGMNKDSALKVLDTFLSTSTSTPTPNPKPTISTNPFSFNRKPSSDTMNQSRQFVYISAADAFRPVVPSRYIETKREAELEIARKCQEDGGAKVKPIFMRPGLMYHPHIRPLTTLPAFLIDMSSKLSTASGIANPFASKSPLHGMMESLRTYPLHVDHVASAVLRCIEEAREPSGEEHDSWGGARVVEVPEMRDWAGLGKNKDKIQVGHL
ncbi:uncharacterized protein IL334_000463 [Kwoniella shivajii]|uniref:NAD-dependent epimerase/dehydratase domain-containing protein n=1 Tax=Kwoniella shivajii TaxID=564305 RepID=A0ABZ1CPF2_9TREE|nr:hypothetical protein IL334_000463 [Kwoniella shivajii]